jgi:hypothetical protein
MLEIGGEAMTRNRVVAAGAFCAFIGGLCWVVKGGWILVYGWQPRVIYEVAPLFFPVAAGALVVLPKVRSRLATNGLVAAGIAELAAVLSVLGFLLGPTDWQPNASTATVLSPLIALSALGTLLSLVLLGLPVRWARALPGRSRNLPLVIGAGAIPALVIGGLLEMLRTHLIETSTVIVGLAWIALAVALARTRIVSRDDLPRLTV